MNRIEKIIRKIARELLLPWRCESRYVLERKIFPTIKNKKVLLVGVADYTKDYPKRLNQNYLWTIDIDPAMKEFGAKKHIVDNLLNIEKHFTKEFFDIILIPGVFGYGLNNIEDGEKVLKSCHSILKKGGELIIQWTDREDHNMINPDLLENIRLFQKISDYGIPYNYRTKNKSIFEFLKKEGVISNGLPH